MIAQPIPALLLLPSTAIPESATFSPDDVPLGTARNDAIRQASGEWIAFLDQDDVWLSPKLEKQIPLGSEGVGLIYGRTVRFYPSGLERDYDQSHEYELLPEGDIFTQLFTKSCFIAMSSAVFRRSAIEAIGGIPDAIQIVPDYYLYRRGQPVRGASRAASRLPISNAPRQHVAYGRPGHAPRGPADDRVLGRRVAPCHLGSVPKTPPHRYRAGRNAKQRYTFHWPDAATH